MGTVDSIVDRLMDRLPQYCGYIGQYSGQTNEQTTSVQMCIRDSYVTIYTTLNFFLRANHIAAQTLHFAGFSKSFLIFNKHTVYVQEVTMKYLCLLDSA